MFDRIVAEPSDEFVASLRHDLLTKLATEKPATDTRSADAALRAVQIGNERVEIAPVPLVGRAQRPLRIVHILAAALIAGLFIGVALTVLLHRPSSITTVPSTDNTTRHDTTNTPGTSVTNSTSQSTAPSASVQTTTAATQVAGNGFSRHVATDLNLASGVNLHFDGTIALPFAVESNEAASDPIHDILLFPKITATFTNTGSTPVSVASATVEVFLRGDIGTCVLVTPIQCASDISRGPSTNYAPTTIAAGANYTINDTADSSTIRVPKDQVAATIAAVRANQVVTGFAISLTTADGLNHSSIIFDRSGNHLLTCTQTPTDCLGPTRSALGPDAAPTTNDSGPAVGILTAGTIAPKNFAVPFSVVTTGSWALTSDTHNTFILTRPATAGGSTFAFSVVTGASLGITAPSDLLSACPTGTTSMHTNTNASVFGLSAYEIDGTPVDGCGIEHSANINTNDTFHVIAVNIQGTILVIAATSPTKDWPTFKTETDAMINSLRLT
jgi:hypothetical protein